MTIYFTLVSFISFQNNIISQQTIKASLIHDQLTRSFTFYIPASYTVGKPTALVFNLHGYGSNADQQEFYADFRKIADTAGFITVHPNGTVFPQTGQQFWNVGLVAGSNVDDVGFLHAIIDTLSGVYTIDADRIYSTGMSNGGFMSYHLACLSNRFAAVASVTGSMTILTQAACKNAAPTPVMEIHGTADAVVNYNGSNGILSIPDVLNFWIQKNGLDPLAVIRTSVADININDGATAEHYVYPGMHEVEHYKVINGGHTWPGSPIVFGTTCQDFNASEVIWKFFSKHRRELVYTTESDKLIFTVYPNPVTDYLQIQNDLPATERWEFIIYNSLGKAVMAKEGMGAIAALNLSAFPAGIYTIRCQLGRKWISNVFFKT